MTAFISNLIGNDYIATVIMSFVPLMELKVAIVFARSFMGFGMALLLAYCGSTIIFFPIYWLLVPILNLLKKIKWFNGFATKVELYFKNKADTLLEKRNKKDKKSKISETLIKQLGVFIFVAIPLPMTGVWTGTAIAVFLGLKFSQAILPIAVGNLVAGTIISVLAEVCLPWLNYILYGLFGLAIISLIVTIIKVVLSKPKQKTVTQTQEDDAKGDESQEEA